MPLTLPGSLHPSNKDAIAWNEKGLLAYGSHNTLIVVDCLRRKIIQTLEKHVAAISHVSWAPEEDSLPVSDRQLRCASADISGSIVVWNILEATPLSTFRHLNSAPLAIAWYPWEDTSSDFLLALHSPNVLVLWNTATGDRIWNVIYNQQLCLFAIDPFDASCLAFGAADGSILAVSDVILHKAPSGLGSSLSVLKNTASIVQLQYHNAFQNILLVATQGEMVCIEMECCCVLWRHTCESPLLRMFTCSDRDALFSVHASGMVVLRIATLTQDSKGNAKLAYERVQSFETQRQSAHHRISATAFCPITQSTFACLYNSGRMAFYQLGVSDGTGLHSYRATFITDMLNVDANLVCSPAGLLRLSTMGEMFSLGPSASSVRMRPMETLEGEGDQEAIHLAAIGSNQGMIHLVNVFTAVIYKELHLHTCPIKCLDWGGPHTLISAAFAHSLSTSPLVRNDIFVTDIRTGESKRLRPEVEETPVEMLRVSFYHCYVAIGFRSEPLEIWHLKSMRLLRRMSRACPVIVDMAWSGKHHAMKKVSSGVEPVFKENLVVLDQDCHLYHVVVKGLHVRDGKEVNSQWKSGVASMKSLVWKDDLLAMGDSSGRLGVWDLGRRQCRQTSGSPRGAVLKMTFSRLNGDHTLAVLHANAVVMWDADQLTVVQQLNVGTSLSLVDLDLCGVCPILLCSDNSFRYVPSASFNMPLHSRDIPAVLQTEASDLLAESPEDRIKELADLFAESATISQSANRESGEKEGTDSLDIEEEDIQGGRDCAQKVKNEEENQQEIEKNGANDEIATGDGVKNGENAPEDSGDMGESSVSGSMNNAKFGIEGDGDMEESSDLKRTNDEKFGAKDNANFGLKHSEKFGIEGDGDMAQSSVSRSMKNGKLGLKNTANFCLKNSAKFGPQDILDKYRSAHRLLGNRWHYDFWTVTKSVLRGTQMPSSLYTFWPAELTRHRVEMVLSCLMSSQDLNSEQVNVLVHRAVVLHKREWAIQMLLAAHEECQSNALRACLLAAEVSSEGAQSIIKLVATNLIANNCITDGIQMLFLIGHGADACRYLQAHGAWQLSLDFAKTGLQDYVEVGVKWLDHLVGLNSQKKLSCMLAVSLGEWDRAVNLLWASSKRTTATQLLNVLTNEGVQFKESTIQTVHGTHGQ